MANREIYTKDDVPLTTIAEKVQNLVEMFNEAARPFRELFVDEVDQETFLQEIDVEADTWEKLSEGEYPGSAQPAEEDYLQMTIRTEEYGKALGFTQKFIERSTEDRILRKTQKVLEGGKQTEEDAIHDVIFNGVADGSEDVWFDVPDRGNYNFSRDHSHTFADTAELFGDSNAHSYLDHIEWAADELHHHGWDGQKALLGSLEFKRGVRNELEDGVGYHIPMATGMRSTDIREETINPRGVSLLTTPYLSGSEFYVVDVGEDPVKEYIDRPMQITQPTGGPVYEPGQIINSTGTMDFGVSMVNPLGAVHFEGTDTNFS